MSKINYKKSVCSAIVTVILLGSSFTDAYAAADTRRGLGGNAFTKNKPINYNGADGVTICSRDECEITIDPTSHRIEVKGNGRGAFYTFN